MTRRLITALVRVIARIFFRRIEIAGLERVPKDAAVIFAVNHPNALIDPLFLLVFAPRPVSFLAKAPLFRTPLIRFFVRAFDSIPVYRKQDVAQTLLSVPSQTGVSVLHGNQETFARARSVLERGGAIAIFPEGTTHSDPHLRQLKTGAARIALGSSIPVSIVPTGLYYTEKRTFRSSALVYFGQPIPVAPEPVDAIGEPRAESVDALTEHIEQALAEVTLQADSHAALELIARGERIFSAGEETNLATELDLRKQFVAGYGYLREHDPARLRRLESQIAQIDAELLAPSEPMSAASMLRLALLPLAIIGAVIHWPVYRLVGFLTTRLAREEEVVATTKTFAGLLLFPLLWIVAAILVAAYFGVAAGLGVAILLPLLGYIALVTLEVLDELIGRFRALRHHDVRAKQRAIREEILAVAAEMSSRA